MWSRVTLRQTDGTSVVLGHGDMIGRLWSAALVLDDPRVSEAHALVSLRGHELKLLALRGRFAVDGRPTQDVTLREGQRISLAEGLDLEVTEVEVPDTVLGLTTEGLPPRPLPGTCALVASPRPGLVPPSHPRAIAHVWRVVDGWRIRPVDGVAQELELGTVLEVGGRTWRCVEISFGATGIATQIDGSFSQPLHLVARYDTVQLFREGRPPVLLKGVPARLVSELAELGAPVPWTVLVGELWSDGGSRKQLDMTLVRLRRHLRHHRVRTDLVVTSGTGMIELLLRPTDSVEVQT